MYKNKTLLALIPARGASKGLPHKNIKQFCGRPLIARTIMQAKKSRYLDRIIVSTDDKEISAISLRYGAEVPVLRPVSLASDTARASDTAIHMIDYIHKNDGCEYECVVLLQPTSPLRTYKDIDCAIEKFFLNPKADAVVSVSVVDENPYWMFVESKGFLIPLLKAGKKIYRRQNLPQVYSINGAVYVCKIRVLKRERTFVPKKSVGFIMPRQRSIDIDEMHDFKLAEMLLKKTGEDHTKYDV